MVFLFQTATINTKIIELFFDKKQDAICYASKKCIQSIPPQKIVKPTKGIDGFDRKKMAKLIILMIKAPVKKKIK